MSMTNNFDKKKERAVLCGLAAACFEKGESSDEVSMGELAALVVADSVARLQPGVLAQPEGYEGESHYNGLLEYPQYTRPELWQDRRVPEVLLSGHHANIQAWQKEQSEARTKERRPDLWEKYTSGETD